MRLKILRKPAIDTVDGIDLRRFVAGRKYELGYSLGALFLAEGWAEPADEHDDSAEPSRLRVAVERHTRPRRES